MPRPSPCWKTWSKAGSIRFGGTCFVIDGAKALLSAAACLDTEKRFRKIIGDQDLWMLQAKLSDQVSGGEESKVA